ncbi:MAG: Phosphoheptose isomerase [Parcubacteria group bacterium GW2011_GWA2_49_9]|nr:MAG: Phosphoheptose isomerase [Parcubacteria group bacterium GW2011_GWA2_49_9]
METFITQHLKETAAAIDAAREDTVLMRNVSAAATLISKCFAKGGKLLIAGNGGSAADAEHFATEFVGRFMKERRARPAIALTSSPTITAWSNDHKFEDVFARQLEAFAKPEDIFFGISTSGTSKNIVRAVEKAKTLGITSVCLLGNSGGLLAGCANITIALTDTRTTHIQEVQIALIHAICGEVEDTFSD